MYKKQRGSTLLISLILLLIFTLLGLSTIGNVSLNEKMTSNYLDADLSFHAAEAALSEGEAFAETISVTLMDSDFTSCSGDTCFTANCNDGKCFSGTYSAGNLCLIDEPATPVAYQDAVWATNGRARESQVSFPSLSVSPKYVVEFMCYVEADSTAGATIGPGNTYGLDWAYLFRITSYAVGANGTSKVKLQSTYKVIR